MQTTIEKLDRLAEFRAQRDLLNLDKQAATDSVLTPEIKLQLADIKTEFGDKSQSVLDGIAQLEAETRLSVLACGQTIKGSRLMAIWTKGRVSWDDKALQGYMKAHPELAEFRKQGEPSVSIRDVK